LIKEGRDAAYSALLTCDPQNATRDGYLGAAVRRRAALRVDDALWMRVCEIRA
jgi:hypothetical protein